MTKDEARKLLEDGHILFTHCWSVSAGWMTCGDECCDGSIDGVEDALETLEGFCNGNWDDVRE